MINSLTNFRVKQWLKLADKFTRDKRKLFLAYGFHSVVEAQKAGLLEEVICTSKPEELKQTLKKNCLSGDFELPVFQVTQGVMEKLSVMAAPPKIIGVAKQKTSESIHGNVVFVNAVHHPGNLGTIIRNCVAFGVETVVIESSVDPYSHKVVQSSQGMIFHVNIVKSPIREKALELRETGYQIIGTDVARGTNLCEFVPRKKWGLVLGNESEGVGSELLGFCDENIKIEMDAKCESLNVGVAAGIVLYHLCAVMAPYSIKPKGSGFLYSKTN